MNQLRLKKKKALSVVFTRAHDDLLTVLAEVHKRDWDKVALEMSDFTTDQLKRRYFQMHKSQTRLPVIKQTRDCDSDSEESTFSRGVDEMDESP